MLVVPSQNLRWTRALNGVLKADILPSGRERHRVHDITSRTEKQRRLPGLYSMQNGLPIGGG